MSAEERLSIIKKYLRLAISGGAFLVMLLAAGHERYEMAGFFGVLHLIYRDTTKRPS